MRGAKYIGDEPHRVRIGDRGVDIGEVVYGPDDVLDVLLARSDFEAVEGEPEPLSEAQLREIIEHRDVGLRLDEPGRELVKKEGE